MNHLFRFSWTGLSAPLPTRAALARARVQALVGRGWGWGCRGRNVGGSPAITSTPTPLAFASLRSLWRATLPTRGRVTSRETSALPTLIIVFLVLSTPALAQVTGALPPTLKRHASVASDVVRIGDLIENAGALGNIPIFRSPDLGQTGGVPAARVIEAVRAHGYLALDTKGLSEVAVTRVSRLIAVKDIEAQIARAVAAQYGIAELASLLVKLEPGVRGLHVDPSAPPELPVASLAYDPRTGRFDISFELPPGASAGARRATQRYTGSIVETAEAAVLVRAMARGEIVKAGDVATERRPKAELGPDPVASDAAVGLAARRGLRAGQPLRSTDLMKPEVVQRNEPVTLVYEMPGMMLTIRGKATESGAVGDLVNVVNMQSKRTVQGTVTGPGRVTVASAFAPAPATLAAVPQPRADVVP
jgi:flagellar basal body P-ring formation protein FlgA